MEGMPDAVATGVSIVGPPGKSSVRLILTLIIYFGGIFLFLKLILFIKVTTFMGGGFPTRNLQLDWSRRLCFSFPMYFFLCLIFFILLRLKNHFLKMLRLFFFLIGVKLLYSVFSAVQGSESHTHTHTHTYIYIYIYIYMHVFPPSETSLPPPPPSHHLGHQSSDLSPLC